MVQSISQKKADPEMEALNGTLDKLLEIQNPGKIKKEKAFGAKDKVFAVTANGSNSESSYFGNASNEKANSFLSDGDQPKDSAKSRVIMAVVHNEQTILAGSVVKLRLVQDVFVNGERIPAGSFVFGNSSIDDARLKVTVHSIQFQNHLYPVALSVVDIDGIEGINIPGSNGREVAKQSVDQGAQSIGGLSFDQSLKAQAAAAGVNAAKNLLSKQVKQVRVTIKAGYKVLLKDENEKNN
jgi:conjugative transposon TraM protein